MESEIQLLKILQKDASLSIRKLAEKLKMRPSTVHERIKRLQRAGILKRKVWLIDAEKVGRDFVAFILLKGKPGNYLTERNILADPRVQEAWGVTGSYDLLLKCRFRNVKEFSSFVMEIREKLREYEVETFSMIATARLKESTEVPL